MTEHWLATTSPEPICTPLSLSTSKRSQHCGGAGSSGDLSDERFALALDDLEALELARFPALPLMRRAYELRANVTAYDAAYVALAEVLRCPLVTADARLARAPGLRCEVKVLRPAPPTTPTSAT